MIHFFPRIGKAWAVHLEQRVKAWGGWGLRWVGAGVGGAWGGWGLAGSLCSYHYHL